MNKKKWLRQSPQYWRKRVPTEGLRDRYIGSLFRVDEPVPDDSGGSSAFSNAKVIHSDGCSTDLRLIDSEATGDTDALYDLLGRKRDAQTKGLVIKNGIKVLK